MDESTTRPAALEIAAGIAMVGTEVTVAVVHMAAAMGRPVVAVWRHAPAPVSQTADRLFADLASKGRIAIEVATRRADAVIGPLGRAAVESTLRGMDLTALVRDQVDVVALATEVVEGLDLSAIVRESTGSLASEAVRGTRAQAMHADDAVGTLADRLLGRRRRTTASPSPAFPGAVPT